MLSDPKRFKFEGEEHYLKSAAEMRYLFRDFPEACDNTLWVAERADVTIEFGKPQLPNFPLPEGFTDDAAYLDHLTWAGRARALGRASCRRRVVERLAYELQVIKNMGFASYFLIVWDLIKHAKDSGIRVGPGRGSAAGCAVAYCLRITDLDPIKYDLLFERFLNPQPHLDARHRHGLRLPLPRRDDPLRGRALRPRPRRPDHHVRHDQGPQRGARRGSRARLPVRRRRQDRQGDAAARDGPRHAAASTASSRARSTPTATRRRPSCGRCTTPTPT